MSPGWAAGLVLGLVQGVTEFLPVSSSGHLLLAESAFGFAPPGVYFEVGLHLATLLAVVVAFRGAIRRLVAGLWTRRPEALRYAGLLVLGSLPAAILGIGARGFFEARFTAGVGVGVGFLATGLMLGLTKPALPRAIGERIGPRVALLVGLAQAVAILPGVSRSGSTIAAALWLGLAPGPAAEFSFLLAVIAIGGSGLLEARHLPPGVQLLAPGFLLAFLAALGSGLWAIRVLVRLLQRQRFHHFGWYCAGLGLLTIWWYGGGAR